MGSAFAIARTHSHNALQSPSTLGYTEQKHEGKREAARGLCIHTFGGAL